MFQILPHIRNHGPLSKPDGCPDWVYILMHQCWAYESVQRPPALAIFDCLTSRYNFERGEIDAINEALSVYV